MRLRTRVLLTTVLVAVPVVAMFAWMERRSRYQLVESSMTSAVESHLDVREIGECNAHPQTWSPRLAPHGPGLGHRGAGQPQRAHGLAWIELYAYDERFQPLHRLAPALAPGLIADLRRSSSSASRTTPFGGREAFETLLRVPGKGPCRYVLARRPVPWVLATGLFDPRGLLTWVLPSLSIVVVVGLAMGAVARRVQRLTAEVNAKRGSAFAGLSVPQGDDEISELARAFVAAGDELRAHMDALAAKERALREFLANTTHDVMIPLTVLQGHLAELARLDGPERLTRSDAASAHTRSHELVGALREAYYIGALLKNLRLAARLDSGDPGLERASFDLRDLVQRVIARHEPVARQQRIELVHGMPPTPVMVMADSLMLEQAMSNVLFNAIRHNREGGHVAVLLECEAQRFLMRTIDDGPGVTDEDLPHLTERRFQTATSRTRRTGGMGLGLDITRQVVERHGYLLQFARSEFGGLAVTVSGDLHETAGGVQEPRPGA